MPGHWGIKLTNYPNNWARSPSFQQKALFLWVFQHSVTTAVRNRDTGTIILQHSRTPQLHIWGQPLPNIIRTSAFILPWHRKSMIDRVSSSMPVLTNRATQNPHYHYQSTPSSTHSLYTEPKLLPTVILWCGCKQRRVCLVAHTLYPVLMLCVWFDQITPMKQLLYKEEHTKT